MTGYILYHKEYFFVFVLKLDGIDRIMNLEW